jgi:hypothetical protein
MNYLPMPIFIALVLLLVPTACGKEFAHPEWNDTWEHMREHGEQRCGVGYLAIQMNFAKEPPHIICMAFKEPVHESAP